MTSRENAPYPAVYCPAERGKRENSLRNDGPSAGFTLDTYAHVTKDTQIQAVNTVSGILTAARN